MQRHIDISNKFYHIDIIIILRIVINTIAYSNSIKILLHKHINITITCNIK